VRSATVPGTPNDADIPRLVIPNVSQRSLLTATNFDLFFFDDRLVARKGLTLQSGARDALEHRRTHGTSLDPIDSWRRQRSRDNERTAEAASDGALDSSGVSDERIVVRFGDIASARLSKRLGIVTLRLRLTDGTQRPWFWMNNSMAKRYADAEPVIRDLLGSLLEA
jgi:hypothetical protein